MVAEAPAGRVTQIKNVQERERVSACKCACGGRFRALACAACAVRLCDRSVRSEDEREEQSACELMA
eukprot:964737-Pleurochrysis_carterae.AAC.2